MEQSNKELADAISKIKKYRFLEALRKKDCPETAEKLARFFYTLPTSKGTYGPAWVQLLAIEATDDLIINHSQISLEIRRDASEIKSKLEELREVLYQLNNLLNDPTIREHYHHQSKKELDVPSQTVLNYMFDYQRKTTRLGFELDLILSHERKPGRPALKGLTEFVTFVSKKFNELSGGENFTVSSEKDDQNNYLLEATDGQLFVHEAIKWMYDYCEVDPQFRYTNSNIFRACKKAKKTISQEKLQQ